MCSRQSKVTALLLSAATLSFYTFVSTSLFRFASTEGGARPAVEDNDWFMLQRAYPHDDVDPARYEGARQAVRSRRSVSGAVRAPWQSVGPSNIGGRITALALDPANSGIIYAGAAAGGVWESTDDGVTWSNIFNESPSTGSLLLHPGKSSTLYVGTGEANPAGVATYPGNGIWRSTDNGQTWTNLGLGNTGYIGRIAIHPNASSRIFVAALGRYRSRTQDRGIFRSTDNGVTWSRVLFLNDTTGACDVVIDPADPNRVLAAMWTRYRPLTYSIIAGPNSGLWLSTDAGDSWTQVTNGFPFNDASLGRTSLAVSESQPNIVYALVANNASVRGVYRSTNGGISWTLVASAASFSSEGQVWYNNVLAVHPTDPNTVLAGMTYFYRSTNGGTSWSVIGGGVHVDYHAITYDQNSPSRIVVGNDGGVYRSTNSGGLWTKSYNLPISQFYAGTIDYSNPQRYFGGMQDNGTARTLTGSPADWQRIYGGDGFYVLVDPTNPNRIYAEYQNGGLAYSTNGGSSFLYGRNGMGTSDRTNWSTPFAMDLTSPLTLYVGTYRVYRTTNGMQSWSPISSDLTRGPNGRIGTITTVDVALSNPNVIYVGTDDAKVSVTTNGGVTWADVTGSLPQRWVTRVTVDPESANVCYVTHSGYLEDVFSSHIHKTTDYGQTWVNIGGDMPDMPVNDIVVDIEARANLYVATDFGVMYSTNQGTNWLVLGTDLPEVPVHDLTFHLPTRKLLASTHGRSAHLVDLSDLLSLESRDGRIPQDYSLDQNYPNPFNPWTVIGYRIPDLGHVSLTVYDVVGREIAVLVNDRQGPGSYNVVWNASGASSGVYLYRLLSGSFSSTRKMLLLK